MKKYLLRTALRVSITVGTLVAALVFTSLPTVTFAAAPNCNLVTGTSTYSPPALTKPGYLQTVTDPTFGTKITRISGDPGTAIPNVSGGVWGNMVAHNYSKDQVWNADMTLFMISSNAEGGTPSGTIFLHGSTYQPQFSRSRPGSEIRWHPTQPDNMVYVSGNVLGRWNVRTNAKTTIRTFSGYSNLQIGPWEGNLSADGSLIALLATNSSGSKVAFAYNMDTDTKYPDIAMGSLGAIDWVSVSAGGTYVVVNHGPDNTSVYTLSGSKVGSTWTQVGRPSHYDLAVDDQGEEVAVGVSKAAPDDGRVIKRRLRDGVVTVLNAGGYASHNSTRNLNRPGWAYTSYNASTAFPALYRGEIIASRLDGGRVERIVHHRGVTSDYASEQHGSPSPDGTRVAFASTWGASSRPVQLYVVDFKDKCSVSDTTLPIVSLTAPTNGSTVSGPVTVSATASDNIGVAGVQFKLDGSNLGSEDTISPYSTSWNTASTTNGSHTLTAVARDAVGNTKTSSAVTVTVNNSSSSCPTSSSSWQAYSFASQSGTFTATFDATPLGSTIAGYTGLSTNPATAFTNMAAIVRFNSTGTIDARNGDNYQAVSTIPYSANTSYRFRLVVNIPTHTYSAYVTPQGGSDLTIGTNYAFRTEQALANSLAYWNLAPGAATHQVCSFTVTSAPPPTLTLTPSTTQVSLTWSSTNATSCSASSTPANSSWSGSKATAGAQSLSASTVGTNTFTLSCTGAGGTVTKAASYSVSLPQ